jgi:hypothetical protein
MYRTRIYLLGSLLVACAVGCQSTPKEKDFLHQYRLNYRVSDAELEELKFYISKRVLVQAIGEMPEFDSSGSGVIIAPMEVKGRIVGVGPDWLRITFGLGDGAYFKTDTSKPFDKYWLATEVAGTDGLVMLKDNDEQDLMIDGITYNVVFGRDAFLMVDTKTWERFVATRTHVPGVQ